MIRLSHDVLLDQPVELGQLGVSVCFFLMLCVCEISYRCI